MKKIVFTLIAVNIFYSLAVAQDFTPASSLQQFLNLDSSSKIKSTPTPLPATTPKTSTVFKVRTKLRVDFWCKFAPTSTPTSTKQFADGAFSLQISDMNNNIIFAGDEMELLEESTKITNRFSHVFYSSIADPAKLKSAIDDVFSNPSNYKFNFHFGPGRNIPSYCALLINVFYGSGYPSIWGKYVLKGGASSGNVEMSTDQPTWD